MLIDALHSALEDAVEAFHGVGMDGVRAFATDVFASGVSGEIVASKVRAEASILTGLVGHDKAGFCHMRLDDRHECGRAGAVHMEADDASSFGAALDEGQHSVLVPIAASYNGALLGADKGFVDFDDGAFAAENVRHGAVSHGLTQPVRHEPSAFHGQAEDAGQLVAGNTLLAGAHQESGLEPHVQLDMAALENRADRDAALLAAGVALIKAGAGGIAAHQLHPAFHLAMRADGAVRPNDALKLRVGGGFVLEVGGIENAGHRSILSMASPYP